MRKRPLTLLALLVSIASAFALVHKYDARTRPRLVLLYAPCTVNKRFLSPYNPVVRYTPRLSEFARGALVFDLHQAEAGRSAIDYAALLTGHQAPGHGVLANKQPLADDAYTLAEAFSDSGFDAHFWTGHPMAAVEQNFSQGVPIANLHDGNAGKRLAPYQDRHFLRGDSPEFRSVLMRLRDDPEYKALVFTAFSVTHGPYDRSRVHAFCEQFPEECRPFSPREIDEWVAVFEDHYVQLVLDARHASEQLGLSVDQFDSLVQVARILYASNIHHLDTLFGELVDAVRDYGLLSESLIVFTADHGEILFRRSASMSWMHGMDLAPEVLGVPLLMSGPNIPAGNYEKMTRSIDVAPTLASLAGADMAPGRPAGRDLRPWLSRLGRRRAENLRAYSHGPAWVSEGMGVRLRDKNLVYKLIPAGSGFDERVYDLSVDRAETTNLVDPDDAAQRRVFADLTAYRQRILRAEERGRATGRIRDLDAAEIEALRQLGYWTN